MYPPGLRLRQIRENMGLTYRDVEKPATKSPSSGAVPISFSISAASPTSKTAMSFPTFINSILWRPFSISILSRSPRGTKPAFNKLCTTAPPSLLPAPIWAKRSCLRGFSILSAVHANCKLPNCSKLARKVQMSLSRAFPIPHPDVFVTATSGCPTGAWFPCFARAAAFSSTPASAASKTRNGPTNTTAPCISLKFETATAAVGFRKTGPGSSCSPTLYRAVLRKSGKSPKKPKSLEESLAWLLT